MKRIIAGLLLAIPLCAQTVVNGGLTFNDKLTLATSTTSIQSLIIPPGVSPTSPTSGSLWNLSGVPTFYNGSANKSLAFLDSTLTGLWNGTAVGVLYGGTGATTASGSRTNLGLVIGTDVQAFNAALGGLAKWTAGVPSNSKIVLTEPATIATLGLANNSTLSTVGGYASTFTFTGASSLTFPTVGTLATDDGALNITSYGCIINDYGNTVDCATAFNAAVAALPASGGTIKIPPGVAAFKTTGADNAKEVHVKGSGVGATVLKAYGALFSGTSLLKFTGNYSSVQDLTIDMSALAGSGDAIEINGDLIGLVFQNLVIANQISGKWGINGIDPSGANGINQVKIDNVAFTAAVGGGVKFNLGGDSVRISNSTFSLGSASTSQAFLWTGGTGAAILYFGPNNNVTGGPKMIEIGEQQLVHVLNNQIEQVFTNTNSVHSAPLVLKGACGAGNCSGWVVRGNNINGTGGNATSGIYMDKLSDVIVEGNFFNGLTNYLTTTANTLRVNVLPNILNGAVLNDATHALNTLMQAGQMGVFSANSAARIDNVSAFYPSFLMEAPAGTVLGRLVNDTATGETWLNSTTAIDFGVAATPTMGSGLQLRLTSTGMLQFQGLTSSFPALKRSSAVIQARLADDSAFADFTAAGVTATVLRPAVNTVTFSATPVFNHSLGNTQKITLTGNVTSSTTSNQTAGQESTFMICQDATGSRTFAWPTTVKGGGTIGSTLSTCSTQNFRSDGTNLYATSTLQANL